MGWESIAVVGFDLGPLLQGQTRIVHKIMCRESIAAVRFDLGPLLQGQMRIAQLKSAYSALIIGPRGLGW